eukprot:1324858-Prymnesium_polylepis.1
MRVTCGTCAPPASPPPPHRARGAPPPAPAHPGASPAGSVGRARRGRGTGSRPARVGRCAPAAARA